MLLKPYALKPYVHKRYVHKRYVHTLYVHKPFFSQLLFLLKVVAYERLLEEIDACC